MNDLIKAHNNGTLRNKAVTKSDYHQPTTATRKENKVSDKQLAKDSGLFARYNFVV